MLGSSYHLQQIEGRGLIYAETPLSDSGYRSSFRSLKSGLLDDEEAKRLIVEPGIRTGIDLSAYMDFTISLSGYHPMFLQMACYHLFEKLSKKTTFSSQDMVKKHVERAFLQDAVLIYNEFWGSLSTKEKEFLSALLSKDISFSFVLFWEVYPILWNSGFIIIDDNNKVQFFSEHFKNYVKQKTMSEKQEAICNHEDKQRRTIFLSSTAACLLALLLIVVFEGIVHFYPWRWVLNHTKTIPLQIGINAIFVFYSVGIFFRKWRKWCWAAGVFGIALVLLGLLGG